MQKPLYQKCFEIGRWIIAGAIILGVLLDSISNAISLIKFYTAFWITTIILIVYVALHYYLKLKGIRWVSKDGQEITIVKLGKKLKFSMLGAICLSWLAVLINSFTTVDSPKYDQKILSALDTLKEISKPPPPLLDISYQNGPNPIFTYSKRNDSIVFRIVLKAINDQPIYDMREEIFTVKDSAGALFFDKEFAKKPFDTVSIMNNTKVCVYEATGQFQITPATNSKLINQYACFIVKYKDRFGRDQSPLKKVFKIMNARLNETLFDVIGPDFYRIDAEATRNKFW